LLRIQKTKLLKKAIYLILLKKNADVVKVLIFLFDKNIAQMGGEKQIFLTLLRKMRMWRISFSRGFSGK